METIKMVPQELGLKVREGDATVVLMAKGVCTEHSVYVDHNEDKVYVLHYPCEGSYTFLKGWWETEQEVFVLNINTEDRAGYWRAIDEAGEFARKSASDEVLAEVQS